MQCHRSLFAILLTAALATACSGGTPSGSLPSAMQSSAKSPQAFGVGSTPAPVALQVVAPVDIVFGSTPAAIFRLTDPKQCFNSSSKSDDDNGGNEHQRDGESRHRSGGASPGYGTPYTPGATTTTTFGPFTLVDPCLGQSNHGNHGDGNRGRHDDAAQRHVMNIVTPPPPPQAAPYIVAVDSTDPTGTMIRIDGAGLYDSTTFTYTFGVQRFGGYTFRSGHTYSFGLAAPATPSPTPEPTEPPEGGD